jgi:hypothetical protein
MHILEAILASLKGCSFYSTEDPEPGVETELCFATKGIDKFELIVSLARLTDTLQGLVNKTNSTIHSDLQSSNRRNLVIIKHLGI